MALANTTDRFGTVSKTLHWLTALGVIALIPLGLIANDMPYETSRQLADKARMFSLHKTLGVAVFLVALAQIAWALGQPKPGLLHPDRRMESLAAETALWLLYGSLVLVPLSGWITHAATTGFAPIWWPFGQNLPLVPKSATVASLFGGAHWVLTRVLILAIVLHIAGALKHHVLDRDATLRRMWFGTGVMPQTSPHRPRARPIAVALALWGSALLMGAALGTYTPYDGPGTGAAQQKLRSGWIVQNGTLRITVTQFGNRVTGTFTDWSAAIRFDETIENGSAGTVDVTIATGSLTLGAATGQAMGPDFFNARDFPTATYVARIVPVTDGYEARGTLTIKGQSMPLTLPFGLSIDGNSSSMIGSARVDRRDFGIGDNLADESALKFGVNIRVELTATRADAP